MFTSANIGQKGFLVMAALISTLLEMPKGDAMPSTGFSIGTTWATRICKEKNLISRIQVHPRIRVRHPGNMYRCSRHLYYNNCYTQQHAR